MHNSRESFRCRRFVKAFALFIFTTGAATAFAAEVTNNGGDLATGSLRGIMGKATDGETITFSTGIDSIRLTGTAASASGNLTLSGNGREAFQTSLKPVFAEFFDAPRDFPWNDFLNKNLDDIDLFDWKNYGMNLEAALKTVKSPLPVLDGSSLTSDNPILRLTSVDGTTRLRALVLQNVDWTVRGENIDHSSVTGAEVTTESLKSVYGGAVEFSGGGLFESDIFADNAVEVVGGNVKGGKGTKSVDTLTEAGAYGGAVSAMNGQTSNAVFRQNTVTARGGTAEGGSMTGPDVVSMDTTSAATASGGAVYFSGGTTNTFSDSVFQGNRAVAVGGSVSGGTSVVQVDSENSVETSASGGAISFGGGTVSSSIFQGNSASATQGSVTGATISGGNSVDAYISLSGSVFGGAVAGIDTIENGTVTGSVFQGNSVSLQGGSAVGSTVENAMVGYASISADGDAYGGAVALRFGTVTESVFEANSVTIVGGTATGGTLRAEDGGSVSAQFNVFGVGGAVMMSGGTVSKSVFTGNAVNVEGSTLLGGNATQTGTGTFFGYLYGYASTEASGGAVGFYSYNGTVSDSAFLENTVTVKGGSAVAATFTGSDRTELDAQAAAFALGKGGAVSFDTIGSITGSFLSGNSVTAVGGARAESTAVDSGSVGWANADALALGGAVFIGGQTGSITDSTLTYNSVTAVAEGTVVQGGVTRKAEAYALGGAVFVNTERVLSGAVPDDAIVPTQFSLNASDGKKTLIAHNTANGVSSGIHFGSAGQNTDAGYVRERTDGAIFTVNTNKTGQVHLLDPVTVDIYSATPGEKSKFVMNVTGTGTFVWGGENVLDANGGSTVNLKSGTVTLGQTLSVGATANVDYRTGSATDAYATASTTAPGTNLNDLVVNIAKGTTLRIDVTRSTGLAAFDFTGATNAKASDIFNVEKGVVLAVETEHTRRILDLEDVFLVADGLGGDDIAEALSSLVKGTGVTSITASNGKIFAVVDYESPIMKKLRSNNNSYNAAKALNTLVSDYDLISEDQFNAIKKHPWAVTPEYALTQMHFTIRVLGSIADMVQQDYFDRYEVLQSHVDRSYGITLGNDSSGYCFKKRGCRNLRHPRLWGGYVGDYSSMYRHAGYEAFKMYADGILVGGDAKIDRCTSLGAYCAYLDETTRFRSIGSAAYSNGLQVGVMARRQMPRGWTWHGDLGYAYFDSDGYRLLNPFISRSNFHQHAATIGLGFEYDILCGPCRFRPFLRNRYVYADQSGITEYGDSGTEATVSGFDGNSFTTNFGFEMARRFAWSRLIFAPRLSFSWEHEFLDKNFTARGFYNGIGSVESFRLSSAHTDRDRFILGTDMRLSFPGFRGRCWSGVIAYDFIVSGNTRSHTATIGLETRF